MFKDELERLFRAYQSPHAQTLVLILGDIQKSYPSGYFDWKAFVTDVMDAMEADDAGQFPDSWFPDGDA